MFRRLCGWLVVILLTGAGVGLIAARFLPVQQLVRPYLRARERNRVLAGLGGYQHRESTHFDLYYTDVDENVTQLILETAEQVWAPVSIQMNRTPQGRIPLVLYPTREELRAAFGWGQNESALGVYWQGTIRLLSPNVWLDGMATDRDLTEFARLNPLAHELTHYILDERTGGNYPRWFTEALAQQVEERVTGYVWLEPASQMAQDLYGYDDLNLRFQALSNQPLAYRQSYLFLRWLADRSGEQALEQLIQDLTKGRPFTEAFANAYGDAPGPLFRQWQEWAVANAALLDRPQVE